MVDLLAERRNVSDLPCLRNLSVTLSGQQQGPLARAHSSPGHRAANGQRASTGAGEPGGGGTTRLPPAYGRVM